ncbi:hypothetical protein JCM11641_002129 [Rhodosporidiobolus odoratus]
MCPITVNTSTLHLGPTATTLNSSYTVAAGVRVAGNARRGTAKARGGRAEKTVWLVKYKEYVLPDCISYVYLAHQYSRTQLLWLTKAVFSSKGPMNRAEMEKKASVGPLYVKPTTSTKPLVLPPRRAGTGAQGDDRARALYDYEGQEAEDLPVREGEELVIVERVSSDWLRCRNTSGSTGLIPTSYVEQM